MPEPIVNTEELDAELERMGSRVGTPADFEVEVRALATRVPKPVSHRSVLKIARVGWASFSGLPDVAGDDLPEFLGRRWTDLPPVRRRGDSAEPRREQLPDEPLHRYVSHLAEELFGHLGLDEKDLPDPIGQALVGYVSVLAVPEFRKLVGWERSLDAHALGMLTAERAMRHLGEVGMTAGEEEACFRWLHLATYDEVSPEHLDEMRARRAVRLAHQRRPAGAVAVMTCEVDLEDALWFHERVSAGSSTVLTRDQLLAVLDQNAVSSDHWAARREGFGSIARLDLTETGAAEGPRHDAFVHGHLMRWLVEEDVPFRSHMLALTTFYSSSIHRNLVRKPAETGKSLNAIQAHLRAIRLLREDTAVPLADELGVLAWLMDQRGIGIRLAPFLDAREQSYAATRAE